jgi:hypothetical protein
MKEAWEPLGIVETWVEERIRESEYNRSDAVPDPRGTRVLQPVVEALQLNQCG